MEGSLPILHFFERIADAFVAVDNNWRYTYVNNKACEVFRKEPHALLGKPIWEIFPQLLGSTFYNACFAAKDSQNPTTTEEYFPAVNCWFESHIYPSPEGISILFRDITAQKQTEAKSSKAKRLYRFFSSVNHMLTRTRDHSALFKEFCDIAVDIGGFRIAWIGQLEPGSDRVIPVVSAGQEAEYVAALNNVVTTNVAAGRGPTGTAIREGRPFVCNDIASDPVFAPWREEALSRGLRASIAIPIRSSGVVIGAYSVYSGEVNFFDDEEIGLLAETAEDIGFVLEVLEKEKARKQAEEALRISERRYQALTESSPVGIFRTNADGVTTYVNPTWSRISGMPRELALGDGWYNAVHPEDRSILQQGWEQAASTGNLSVSEYRFVRPDGQVAWVMGQAMPETDVNGAITGYIGTVTDITRRKQAEDLLRFNEEQLKMIYESVADPLFLLAVHDDGNFVFISVNRAFLDATGLTETMVVGKSVKDIIPQPALDMVQEKYRMAIREKRIVQWEEVSKYPAGVKTGIVSVNPVFDRNGVCTRLVGTVHDITLHKEYEEMLKGEKSFSESIINSLPGILYLYDEAREFIRWNKNFETVSGYAEQEIRAMHPLDFFDGNDKQLVDRKIEEVFSKGLSEVEASFCTRDGKKIPYYFNGKRILLNNKPVLIGMGIDVTELKNAKATLEESERRFRTTLDLMLEGVQIFDFNWQCIYVNEAAIRQGMLTREQLLGQTLLENYPGIEDQSLFKIFEECRTQRVSKHIEYEFTFADQTRKWFELSIQPNPEGTFVLSVDISDRKAAEAYAKEASEQLRRLTVHQQSVLEEERKRISREIHDELGQQLTAVKIDVAWIDKRIDSTQEALKVKLKNVISLLDRSNQSIRKILTELRMGVLENSDIIEALESNARQFASVTGVPVRLETDKRLRDIDEQTTACLYRAFQEALTNIAKYAEAKEVVSSLEYRQKTIRLSVSDNGKGFDTTLARGGQSFGLLGMRERVASLNGRVEVDSAPGKGTTIRVIIPYQMPRKKRGSV